MRRRLKQKTASGLAVSLSVLSVSAPPDRLGRGIKAAKEAQFGLLHARQFIKTRGFATTAPYIPSHHPCRPPYNPEKSK
jgi:hypothetical protein